MFLHISYFVACWWLCSPVDVVLQVYQEVADLLDCHYSGENIYFVDEDVKVYNSLSNMLLQHPPDSKGALQYALKAVKRRPGWANSHYTLANALMQLGRLTEAKVFFEKALKINPQFSAALLSNYGDCLKQLELLEQAETHLQKSLQLNSTHLLTKFRLASLMTELPNVSTVQLLQAQQL